ncbi:FAD-dependent oxidoreductase [Eubacterium multiforme]|uniref:Thioredoxin reductase n=1 Tax=Eubacterium multiforme TaxID=83339 RepID=A0ABT9UQ46_9FIRM|nr:FAD-dependent oxidoreductase [Eubacterium multiforme]MDQ0148246.1 thioredoxin reductase [Eubacterium multiforme]
MKCYDLVIIGGGVSGINCALFAKASGIKDILLIEKDDILMGSLIGSDYNISEGGMVTGAQYREKKINEFNGACIDTYLNTMVLKIDYDREIVCTSKKGGIEKIKAEAIIMATGGKEKGRDVLNVTGDRCSGIITVGMAEKILNMDGMVPGKDVVLYGVHNINKIYNKIKNKNINVKGAVCNKVSDEVLGLTKNLYLGYELQDIIGKDRIEMIKITKNGEEMLLKCDTLIIAKPMVSDGILAMRSGLELNPDTTGPLVDENFMTSKRGIFACGDGIYIHASVEEIVEEAKKVVENIIEFLK